jgi:UDP-N-acetylglucosamine 2-epimerase (non-hydrolysing)
VKPRIAVVAGARPNFMKVAPVLRAIRTMDPCFTPVLVHTGQHYSPELSDVFFSQLEMQRPDVHLEVGSGTHAQQTARVLELFERFLLQASPQIAAVMVVGDVNSTVAAALAAAKLQVPVIHLEAGLRSFDRRMPEEINRLATDAISDLLLVSEPAGEVNLRNEGVPESRIRYVGNVMIDTLAQHLSQAENMVAPDDSPFAMITLHRPSNVDSRETLGAIVEFLGAIARRLRLVFPAHPRTLARLQEFGLLERLRLKGIELLPAQGYVENLALMRTATFVLTDSGGIQEETSYLSVPCLTMRENTERPSTLTTGSNTLVGLDFKKALNLVEEILCGRYRKSQPIRGWDGDAARRVVNAVEEFMESRQCFIATG